MSATLPLFEGGARRAERTRAELELERLRLERGATAERIEQRIRSTLHFAGASFAAVDLSETAADAARRNLELVTDAYEQGSVSILALLDAQNEVLVAGQIAASAVYDYLVDLIRTQRAIGRFDFFMTVEERQSYLERLSTFFVQAGYDPRSN